MSKPMLAGELLDVDAWKQNISERNVRDYVGDILFQNHRQADELVLRERNFREWYEHLRKAEARPIWWAIGQTWRRILLFPASMCVIAAIAAWRFWPHPL